MKHKLKKLVALMSSSLLAAGALFTFGALPAKADAAAPSILLDFESETLVADPWPSLPGMQFSGNGDNGWVNYVGNSDKPGGSVGSTKMMKAKLGSGAYSGVFINKTVSDSMISSAHPIVTMNFWSPTSGKVVALHLENGDYPDTNNQITVNSTSNTVAGWQTLSFDFSTASPDYAVVYNRMWLDYDPSSTALSPDLFIDDVAMNGATSAAIIYAPAPPTVLNFESETLVVDPWPSLPGMQFSGNGDNGWVNYVPDADKPSGSVGSAKMLKATMGSGGYSGIFLNKTTTTSMISSVTQTVTMNFWSPASGKTVSLHLENGDYPDTNNRIAIDASATTVSGWQTLTFDFSSQSPDFSVVYNRMWIDYDPSSTAISDAFFIDDIAFNGASGAALTGSGGGGGGNTVTTYNVRLDAADRPAGSTINHNTVLNWWTLGDGRPANDGIYVRYMDKGATFNLDYTVTDQDGAAVSGETVELAVTVPDNNVTWNDSNGTARTTYTLSGTTNSSGVVTFTVTNTNTLAENRRNDLTTWTDPSGLTFKWEFLPNIPGKGSATQNLDRIWGHVVDTTANLNAPAYAKIRFNGDSATKAFQAPSNWGVGSDKYIRYQTYGEAMELSYKVTDDANAPMADQTVTLTLSDNGTWTVDGVAKDTGDQITATTNAQGIATFNLVNTNAEAAAESGRPSNMLTTWTENTRGTPDLVGAFIVSVGANTEDRVTLWTHITLAPTAAVVIPVETENKGAYPHIRLDKPFLDTKFDASWWDGVWQYRDADTKAYLKYVPVGSTFKLTYVVTDNDNRPMSGVPVSLIVNANHSCSKTFFFYEGSLIGPDDCSGGGQTELPAKLTDSFGRVSFVLTNTNAIGEAMPLDLNGLPNGKEIGTNIKPHLVGATVEAIDMLFAHFVTPNEKASAKAPAATSVIAGQSHLSTFTFLDENGNPIADANVLFMVNGGSSRTGWASTDKQGRAVVRSASSAGARGQQIVAVSLIREGKLPLTASTTINLISSKPVVSIAGSKKSVVVTVRSASGKAVKISVGGKVFNRTAKADSASFRIPASAGAKKVVVTVSGKSSSKTVTVTK